MARKLIDTIADTLDEATYDEINALVKDIKTYSKDRLAGAKETLIEEAKASINEGDEVCVTYKDGELFGTVIRVGEKTFTIKTEVDGELKKIPRPYHLYVGHVEEQDLENTA